MCINSTFWTFFFYAILIADTQQCTICLQSLGSEYSVDAWGNAFHSSHEKEGLFCHSCSRIISQGVTRGGYNYPDGRHLCSLCKITAIKEDSSVISSYQSVITQLRTVGIIQIPNAIPINLVDLNQLNKKAGNLSHAKLKGFTQIGTHINSENNTESHYTIFILNGLPKVEFKAVLAHEILHVWLANNTIQLNEELAEGFCNLGSYLIYTNDGTLFSQIHLQAMENDPDVIYGSGFRNMKLLLFKIGWDKLLTKIRAF